MPQQQQLIPSDLSQQDRILSLLEQQQNNILHILNQQQQILDILSKKLWHFPLPFPIPNVSLLFFLIKIVENIIIFFYLSCEEFQET